MTVISTPAVPQERPRFTVIVSSFNYEHYVADAVWSALRQTLPPEEVIVVDDGSTDASLQVLHRHFAGHPQVRIVSQSNQGQMAAWRTGCELADSPLIALLDSDDLWHPEYLQRLADIYQRLPTVDYVYCNMELFGARQGLMLAKRRDRHSRDLGLSMLLGVFTQRWQGVATSGNTLRKELLAKILAMPNAAVDSWRSRPDDCLFYGSDILGAHKYYLAEPLARHREHESNALTAYRRSPIKQARYRVRFEKMLKYYADQADFSTAWLRLASSEFATKPRPLLSEWWLYTGFALRAPQRWSRRLSQAAAILRHYLRQRLTGAAQPLAN